jgi:hypothetical protein
MLERIGDLRMRWKVVGWIQNEFGLRHKEPEDLSPSSLSTVRKSDVDLQERNSLRVGMMDSACPLLFLGIFKGVVAALEISLKGEERRVPRTAIALCPIFPPSMVKTL